MTAGASIEQRASASAAARILFPAVDGPPLRNVAASALLRLPDGSVRFLRLGNAAWTDERLDCATQRLQFVEDGRVPPALVKALGRDLGDASLVLANLALDQVDAPAWDLRRAALAYTAGAVARPGTAWTPAHARAQVEAQERRWHDGLAARLRHFVAGLDAAACAAARAAGPLDTDVYNFLVRAPRTAWRQQFVRTFPVLVPHAVGRAPGGLGAFLRASVDAGRPLVKALAARWSVGESAIRALVDRPAVLLGPRWPATPHHLARILDAVRPEDRPGDELADWHRFNAAVATAEEIFRRPADGCPLVLGWIRQAGRRRFDLLDGPAALTPDVVAAIDRLRAALAAHAVGLARAVAGPDLAGARAPAVADRLLATLPAPRLAAIARRFAAEHATRRASLEEEARRTGGLAFWPLLPEVHVAALGTVAVVPLASLAELRDEGAAQALCIEDGVHLVELAGACARGEAYVLSLRDPCSGVRQSTAELRPTRRLGIGAPVLRVHQHRAYDNGRPSSACAQALREVLAWANGAEGERHRARGLAQAQAAGEPQRGPAEAAALAALPPAVGPVLLGRLADDLGRHAAGWVLQVPAYGGLQAGQDSAGHEDRTRA